MSLFGKILAVFNFLGVIGLIVLAIMDYGKRQQWAYSVLRHELALGGIAVDDQEKSQQGYPLVDKLSDETLKDMFSQVGGDPQKTQVDEVKRVQGSLEERIKKEANNLQAQTHLLARILLPMADTYLEREELLALRIYLANDEALAAFKDRYQRAFNEAIVQPDVMKGKTPRSFEESFRLAMRTLGGEPSEVFTSTFLAQFPNLTRDEAKKVKFDDAWNSALKKQNESLQERLKLKFDKALLSIAGPQPPGQAEETQKRAIARLLFALAPVMAEEAADNDPKLKDADKGSAAYGTALLETSAYQQALRRLYVVCGLRTTLAAIGDEAELVRELAAAASRAQEQDLTNFVMDHAVLVEDLKDRATLLQTELNRVADNTNLRDAQKTLVAQRKRDVDQLRKELNQSRDKTEEASKDLDRLSDEVMKIRLKLRDAIQNAQEREKAIRDLESFIRARERNSSKK